MGLRTIRLDDDAESMLAALRKRTGLSISEVFKRGLQAYADSAHEDTAETPYDIYRRLDPGPGGNAIGPASNAKAVVAEAIRKKHGR